MAVPVAVRPPSYRRAGCSTAAVARLSTCTAGIFRPGRPGCRLPHSIASAIRLRWPAAWNGISTVRIVAVPPDSDLAEDDAGSPSSRTASAAAASTGRQHDQSGRRTATSKTRLINRAGPRRFGFLIRMIGMEPMWSARPVSVWKWCMRGTTSSSALRRLLGARRLDQRVLVRMHRRPPVPCPHLGSPQPCRGRSDDRARARRPQPGGVAVIDEAVRGEPVLPVLRQNPRQLRPPGRHPPISCDGARSGACDPIAHGWW